MPSTRGEGNRKIKESARKKVVMACTDSDKELREGKQLLLEMRDRKQEIKKERHSNDYSRTRR